MLLLRYCRTEGSCDYTTVVMYRTRSDVESTAETLRGGKLPCALVTYMRTRPCHEFILLP